jgi:hypothetical protein
MKALVEGLSRRQASVKLEGTSYGIGLVCDCAGMSIDLPGQSSALWISAMKLAESKELTKEKLHLAGNSICQTTGWDDLVDSMSIHAYIARSQHEAIVEEKRKRNEVGEGSSKKANRVDIAQQAMPRPKASMKGRPSSLREKGKALAYKLQSNIEVATDLKKVLEEHILNGKVEFTLDEVLRIAKHKFHEVIIDIIKRKRQSLGDAASSKTQGMKMEEGEEDEDVIEHLYGGVAKVGLIGEDGEIQASSHYSRSHSARATTETLVNP